MLSNYRDVNDATLDQSPLAILGWAAYLAASWTWVIGMYLPVLLVRDFGIWGWIVFAFPNVLGAAAMGSVLANAGRSRKLLDQHLHAAAAFSIVTIAFHVFFIGWILPRLLPPSVVAGVFLLAGVLFAIGGGRRDLLLAAVTLLASVAAFIFILVQPLNHLLLFNQVDPSFSLFALAPVCMFGFFLCPYLDLTFHRARQNTAPLAGARAFQIGFGVMFFAMIVFTLLYARFMDDRGGTNRLLDRVIGLHMLLQIAFTLAVHVRSLLDETTRPGYRIHRTVLAVAVLLAMGLAGWTIVDYPRGELVYRAFMGFYGLIFPAYVWLCMIPRHGQATLDRQRLTRFVIAVVLALPFYWVGFVAQRYGWLAAGLVIVVAMRWTIRPQRG